MTADCSASSSGIRCGGGGAGFQKSDRTHVLTAERASRTSEMGSCGRASELNTLEREFSPRLSTTRLARPRLRRMLCCVLRYSVASDANSVGAFGLRFEKFVTFSSSIMIRALVWYIGTVE